MKKRYLYVLLFGIPGLFVAGILSILLFGAVAGILWLYIFGDNPWPSYTETVLSVLFVLSVMAIWAVTIILGYVMGRRLEKDPILNRSHIFVSAGLTLIFLLLILFQQWSAGSFGTQTDTVLCSEFCARHGYSGSDMPPRDSGEVICSCFDGSGNEVLAVPLDQIIPVTPK